jgi:FkbM family methyltransferase
MGTAVIVGQNFPDASSDGIVAMHARTLIFEPLPAAAKECRERYRKNPAVMVIEAACGEAFHRAPLTVYNESGLSSSLGKMTQQAAALYDKFDLTERGTIEVQVVILGLILDLLGVRSVDFLMIDAQGMDFAILKTLEPMISSNAIGHIQLESDGGGFRHYEGLPDNSESAVIEWMAKHPRYALHRLPNRMAEQPDLVFYLTQ